MADFRSERMPSPEGEGRAKEAVEAAWRAYYSANKAVNIPLYAAMPWLRDISRGAATAKLFDTLGFWIMWKVTGGFDGMQKALGLSRSGMYRRVAMFREVFGEHPDVLDIPGIEIDPVKFLEGINEILKKRR